MVSIPERLDANLACSVVAALAPEVIGALYKRFSVSSITLAASLVALAPISGCPITSQSAAMRLRSSWPPVSLGGTSPKISNSLAKDLPPCRLAIAS